MTSTAFRQCRPSDREKALPLIISSGPEAFHYVFCDRQSEQLTSFLERAFVAKGNEFSHDQHLALIDNDQLVAVGALRYAEQTNRFTLAAMRLIFAHWLHCAQPGAACAPSRLSSRRVKVSPLSISLPCVPNNEAGALGGK